MTETVAFLFADLEGSTRLIASLGAERYGRILTDYRRLVGDAASAEEGRVIDHEGDGLFAVFPTAVGALRAAAEAQRSLAAGSWPEGAEISARIGVHAGEAERHAAGYVGLDVHRAARVAGAAHGGQVLLSEAARILARDGVGDEFGLRDLGEHRLKDLDRVEQLHQLVIPGMRHDFPPLRTLEGTPNNLPLQTTSFVGRSAELAALIELIRSHRLVTVTGVGGSGKTRLALQVAAQLVTEFHDGVWLVELGAITDPQLVDGALLDALHVTQRRAVSPREAALDHLSSARALIVLDNCEHLIGAAADLTAAVLGGAPEVKVIATSREPLGVPGEVIYATPSMTLPRDEPSADPAKVASFDAVRLFLERAMDVHPAFRLTPENTRAVSEICRRLDGMPLALELAAPRLRTFSPARIATLLDQRFRLLTGGSRTALPRQQTLNATIDWSYRLLGEGEQLFFRRLSVFQGGFTFDAAAAVCTDDQLAEADILELLPALVDKSLVVADTDDGDVRYRLLETIRQFARDRLDAGGGGEQVRDRHARYFRDLVVEAIGHAFGPDELAWRVQIDAEADNLRQAMTWSLEAGEPVASLEMARSFAYFAGWWEGLSWLDSTIPAAWPAAEPLLRARALAIRGTLLDAAGEFDQARDELVRAIEIFRQLDGEGIEPRLLAGLSGFADALLDLAVALFHAGKAGANNELFTKHATESLEIGRRLGDQLAIASALGNLAHHKDPQGDRDHARELFEEAAVETHALGSDRLMAVLSQQRAFFEFDAGELAVSREAWRAAVRHAELSKQPAPALRWRAYLAAVEVEMGLQSAGNFVANVRALFERPEAQPAHVYQELLVFRAGVDAARGQHEQVAVAAGASAAEAARGAALRWDLVTHLSRATERARAALGDEPYGAAAERGAAMTREEVRAFVSAD